MKHIISEISKISQYSESEQILKFQELYLLKNKIFKELSYFNIFYKMIIVYYNVTYKNNEEIKINYNKISIKYEFKKIIELINEMFCESIKELKNNYRKQILIILNNIQKSEIIKEKIKINCIEFIKKSNNPKYDKIKELIEKYNNIKKSIAENNYKLVYHLFKIWKNKEFCKRINENDIFNSGMIGLLKSIDLFDYHRKIKFSAFSNIWINSTIQSYVYNANTVINRTLSFQNKLFKIYKSKEELKSNNIAITIKNISLNSGISEKTVKKLLNLDKKQIDIDKEEIKENLIAVLDEGINNIENEENKEYILNLIESLTFRDKEIIKNFYGINKENKSTLEEIGKIFNVSRERIRQIIEKNLKILLNKIENRKYQGKE